MTDPVFFVPSRQFTAGEIAELTGAEIRTPERAANVVVALSSADQGGPGTLIFIDGKRSGSGLRHVEAAAILCTAEAAAALQSAPAAILVSSHPQRDFAAVGRLMFPVSVRPAALTGEGGISSAAHVDPLARLEPGTIIEAGAVIGPDVEIGRGTVVAANAVIGASCRIGRDSHIGPGVVIQNALIGDRVILHAGAHVGQDGFGFVAGRAGPEKIPQLGRVVIQDDVEIGANTTIDRGALSDTVIGEGTKIDNLVQIAHNVRIGRFCLIAGQCGLAGSTTLGDGVMLGGRAGVSDHVTIGSGAAVAAASGVMHDVPPGERWAGAPARPVKEFFREVAMIRKLAGNRASKGQGDD